MTHENQLPVPTDGPLVHLKNPEEYAAMLQATHWLGKIRAEHNKELSYVREADNECDDQFLWGQDFEVTPEVWEYATDEAEDITNLFDL